MHPYVSYVQLIGANYKFLSLSANFMLTTKFGAAESGQKPKTILTLDNTYNALLVGHPSIDSIYLSISKSSQLVDGQ